jgi:hypothetical protein
VTPQNGQVNGHLAVFDIDGVVADVRHRVHHLAGRRQHWGRFFAAAGRDTPLREGVDLALQYAKTHVVVWLTGRPEHLRDLTAAWLARHGLPNELLFMRPDFDRTPAREFKARQLRLLARESTIDLVVDDDPEVFRVLAEAGFPVQLADWVPYGEALRDAQERRGRT